jgi:hypothetical protein
VADFPKAWQEGNRYWIATKSGNGGFPPFLKLARSLQSTWHPADERTEIR